MRDEDKKFIKWFGGKVTTEEVTIEKHNISNVQDLLNVVCYHWPNVADLSKIKVYLDTYMDYDVECINIELSYDRISTKEEKDKWKADEERKKSAIRDNDLKQLEILKRKLGVE